jgi:hypothetical protein
VTRCCPPDQQGRSASKIYSKNITVTCRHEVSSLGGSDLSTCIVAAQWTLPPRQLLMDPILLPANHLAGLSLNAALRRIELYNGCGWRMEVLQAGWRSNAR